MKKYICRLRQARHCPRKTPGVCFHPLNPTGKSYLLPRIIAYTAYCPVLPTKPASPTPTAQLHPGRTALPPKKSPRGMLCPPVLDNRNCLRIRGGGTFVGPVGPVGPVGRWGCRQDQPQRQVIRIAKPPPGYAFTHSIPRANLACSHGSLPIRPIPAYCPVLPTRPVSPHCHQAPTPTAQQTTPAYCLSRFFLRRYTF